MKPTVNWNWLRWAVFAFLCVVLLSTALSLGALRSKLFQLGEESSTGPVWYVMSVQNDLIRLERALAEFSAGFSSSDEINLRLDLLWSRVSDIDAGETGGRIAEYGIDTTIYEELFQYLRASEDEFLNLGDNDASQLVAIDLFRGLAEFDPEVQKASLAALEASSRETKGLRDGLVRIASTHSQLGMLLVAGVLALLLIVYFDSRMNARRLAEKTTLLEQANAANVAKSQFISIVNHELRTPLSSISGAIRMLDSGALGKFDPKPAKMLAVAGRNCEKLKQLIDELLDAEKVAAGKMEFHFAPLDLAKLVKEEIEAYRYYARNLGVDLELDIQAPPPVLVKGDGKRLSQSFVNLLSNACKFSNEEATVTVTIRAKGSRVFLEVEDRGRGIPDHAIRNVFDTFYQVDSSNERERGGTGLGLSIVKRIVEAHRGTVYVESAVGVGTTFTIELERARRGDLTEREALPSDTAAA